MLYKVKNEALGAVRGGYSKTQHSIPFIFRSDGQGNHWIAHEEEGDEDAPRDPDPKPRGSHRARLRF